MTRTSWWIVAYDIASPRRLVRVHRFLKQRGLATQYSVFTVETNSTGLNDIMAGDHSLRSRRYQHRRLLGRLRAVRRQRTGPVD